MRDYGTVSPKFWTGSTGKALRGNANAQLLALYLMTSPHANMIGVYHCPILYMAHETGMDMEGASKALQSLVDSGFCTFEAQTETVFVHRMAAFQVGESLKPGDNRVRGVQKDWGNIDSASVKSAFHAMYCEAFLLPPLGVKAGFDKAPSKPLPSQEQEQEQEQEQNILSSPTKVADLVPDCPHQKILALWAEHCPTLTQPKRSLWPASDGARALTARWRWVLTGRDDDGNRMATNEAQGLAWFARFFDYVAGCPHLVGQNDRGWTADLAWAMKPANFAKVMQGNYERRREVA